MHSNSELNLKINSLNPIVASRYGVVKYDTLLYLLFYLYNYIHIILLY